MVEEEYSPARVYKSFEEFHALDDLDIRFLVVDWEMGRKSFMWGNRALLQAFNMTQAELNAWNFKDQSAAANDYHRSVWQAVQVEKGRIERMKTAYPKGKPVPAIQSFRPIEMQLSNWPEQRTVMLMELKEPESPASSQSNAEDSQNMNWAFAEELLRYTEAMTMMLDCKTEEMQYENQSSRMFYAELQPESTVVADQTKRTGSSREQARRTLGEVLDTCVWEEEGAREQILHAARELTLSSGRLEFECQKAKPDGGVCWHKVHIIACLNPNTGQSALILNEYDVTALKVQAEQLVAASQSQEQFFAAISHELRTPLNGIIGLSESLLSTQQLEEKTEFKLELIRSSGLRLAGLVNDILDAASAKRAAFLIKHQTVHLLPICQSVCGVLAPLINKDVQLVNNLQDALPTVEGDHDRITQILLNLVSNAIKFTERGSITLSASLLDSQEVQVEVADTGIGIPNDKLEQIFLPFQQVDMSTTRKYGGTGLGLSLVKEMVEAHGGRVGVRSEHGGERSGTTFYFVLPISQANSRCTSSCAEDAPDTEQERFGGHTIKALAEFKTAQLASAEDSSPLLPSSRRNSLWGRRTSRRASSEEAPHPHSTDSFVSAASTRPDDQDRVSPASALRRLLPPARAADPDHQFSSIPLLERVCSLPVSMQCCESKADSGRGPDAPPKVRRNSTVDGSSRTFSPLAGGWAPALVGRGAGKGRRTNRELQSGRATVAACDHIWGRPASSEPQAPLASAAPLNAGEAN